VAFLRHKRDTNARQIPRAAKIAAPLAVAATLGAVGVGVVTADPQSAASVSAANKASIADVTVERDQQVSRSASRAEARAEAAAKARRAEKAATRKAIANADKQLWTTAELNLWSSAEKKAELLGLLDGGKKILVTGRRDNGRAEIVLGGKARWVTADYLAAEKPEPEPTLGASCTNGTSVPSGVSPNIKKVHEAVCANFPEISVYGTFRGDGEHSQGIAIDIMVSGGRGWEVAEFVRANAGALGVSYAIYSQKIWSVERGGEGWRGMSDRGSTTANHYDHVHVTTY